MFEPGSFKWAHGYECILESLERKRREEHGKKFFTRSIIFLGQLSICSMFGLVIFFGVRGISEVTRVRAELAELLELQGVIKVRVAAVPTAVAASPVTEETARTFFNVNYDFSRVDALAPGKFKYINSIIREGSFPIGDGTGEKRFVGDLVGGLGYCRDRAEAYDKLAEELKKRGPGWRAMTVREFSAFAGIYPELCKDKWIAILGSVGEGAGGDRCVACFSGTNGDWGLFLDLVRGAWNDYWLFAVVREFAVPVAATMVPEEAVREVVTMLPADERFCLVKTFDLTVPENYDHATQLTKFEEKHRKEFYAYNNNITDSNFSKATTKLTPGRKFKVKVFQITQRVGSEDCLNFLKAQRAVLVGAQGASLIYELKKEELPVSRWSVSFDERDALWEDIDGFHRVPYLYAHSDGDFGFRLGLFESFWSEYDVFLCFSDSTD